MDAGSEGGLPYRCLAVSLAASAFSLASLSSFSFCSRLAAFSAFSFSLLAFFRAFLLGSAPSVFSCVVLLFALASTSFGLEGIDSEWDAIFNFGVFLVKSGVVLQHAACALTGYLMIHDESWPEILAFNVDIRCNVDFASHDFGENYDP